MASNFNDNATTTEGPKPWTTVQCNWCPLSFMNAVSFNSGPSDVDPEMGDYVVVELKGEMSLRREPWDILRAIVEGNERLGGKLVTRMWVTETSEWRYNPRDPIYHAQISFDNCKVQVHKDLAPSLDEIALLLIHGRTILCWVYKVYMLASQRSVDLLQEGV
ncbi:hypothetical protein Q7C36_009836 [Tachysurus vachellii]|uniref:Uncharacterized protein n=1 Tax=Tachysurus vachellii TaxID=175792 RepID=A0AA88MZ41_TACVA|nr:hypothetical protein Q7C36_009836 [Tachysurus vachellii]